MNILSTFTETLNDLMIENNIKAIDLAKALDLGTSTLSRFTRGQRLPKLECLVKIANYFNCTTDYLLGLEDENYTTDFLPCPPFKERLDFLLNYFNRSSYITIRIYLKRDFTIGKMVLAYQRWTT